MPLYPEFPQGVLSPEFFDSGRFGTTPPYAGFPEPSLDAGPIGSLPADFTQKAGALANPDLEVKRPGFLGRIRQQPGGRRALLSLGASLLSNPNFFQGLGQGALAYQTTLDQEADKLKPQLTKDSTFSYVRNPVTGELEFKRTAVADFDDEQQMRKLQAALATAKLRDEGDTKRLETTMGYRNEWEKADDDLKAQELKMRDSWNVRDNDTDIQIARINGENAFKEAQARLGVQANKPPPVGIQKQISEFTQTRDAQSNAVAQVEPILSAIERGDLHFSLGSNLRHKAAIATGVGSTPETVFYSQYQTTLESLRNALLVANKGVQTDGDAERAMAELVAGNGNTETVLANLRRVAASLRRRTAQAQTHIDDLARQYGADVDARSPGTNPSPTPSRPVTTRSGTTHGVRWRIVD